MKLKAFFAFLLCVYVLHRLVRIMLRGAGKARRLRLLRRTPVTPIAKVTAGQVVKLFGRVRLLREPSVTPFCADRCVLYQASVEAGRDGAGATIASAEERADFLLEDESGEALVRVEGASLLLTPTYLRQKPDPKVDAFSRAHRSNGSRESIFQLYTEAAVREGEVAQVMGQALADPDPDASPQHDHGQPPRRLVMRATPEVELIVSSYSEHMARPFQLKNRRISQEALDALVNRE